jgi:hypothetical protein
VITVARRWIPGHGVYGILDFTNTRPITIREQTQRRYSIAQRLASIYRDPTAHDIEARRDRRKVSCEPVFRRSGISIGCEDVPGRSRYVGC